MRPFAEKSNAFNLIYFIFVLYTRTWTEWVVLSRERCYLIPEKFGQDNEFMYGDIFMLRDVKNIICIE